MFVYFFFFFCVFIIIKIQLCEIIYVSIAVVMMIECEVWRNEMMGWVVMRCFQRVTADTLQRVAGAQKFNVSTSISHEMNTDRRDQSSTNREKKKWVMRTEKWQWNFHHIHIVIKWNEMKWLMVWWCSHFHFSHWNVHLKRSQSPTNGIWFLTDALATLCRRNYRHTVVEQQRATITAATAAKPHIVRCNTKMHSAIFS